MGKHDDLSGTQILGNDLENHARPPFFDLLSKIDVMKSGVEMSLVLAVEAWLNQSKNPLFGRESLLSICPQLCEAALEQGRYQLALDLGLEEPLGRTKALLFTGQQEVAQAEWEHLRNSLGSQFVSSKSLFSSRSLGLFSEMEIGEGNQVPMTAMIGQSDGAAIAVIGGMESLILRVAGKVESAWKAFEENCLPNLEKCSSEVSAELSLIGGSLCFNRSDYQQAFEFFRRAYGLFLEQNRVGKICVAAFNASTALHYLNRKLDCNYWLWIAEELLQTYTNESLRNSIDLSRIEYRLDTQRPEDARLFASEYLHRKNLSIVQNILGLHALAKSAMEVGQLFEAEVAMSKSQRLMNDKKFFQYELFQRAIETDFSCLVHRDIRRTKIQQNLGQQVDQRANLEFRIAQARLAFFENDIGRTIRLCHEIQQKSGTLPEDLRLFVESLLLEFPRTARAQESYIYLSLFRRRPQFLKGLKDSLSHMDLNPWQSVLIEFVAGVIDFVEIKPSAVTHFLKAIQLADQFGFERLASLSLGFLAKSDQAYLPKWLEHIGSLNPIDRAWLEDLLNKTAGRVAASSPKSEQEKREVALKTALLPVGQNVYDLEFNSQTRVLLIKGQEVPVKGIAVSVIEELLRAHPRGLTKEDLIEKVWKQKYDPMVHDSLVYTTMTRIRDLVDVDCESGRYRLSLKLKTALIDGTSTNLTSRQKAIIELFAIVGVDIQRSNVVCSLNISERTALRELSELTKLGVLEKSGAGRGTSYKLKKV